MRPDKRVPLTWEIRTCATRGPNELLWGDYHYARDVRDALERRGYPAWVSRLLEPTEPADVVLHLRGNVALFPQSGAINILWVISHPGDVGPEEFAAGFDHIAAATSTSWPGRAEFFPSVETLLQATNPHRFMPDAADPSHPAAGRLLFVGNARQGRRRVVMDCLETGEKPLVYGAGWTDAIPPELHGGHYLPNEELPVAYASAACVLNDHWPDMAAAGFVSNRLFDATAAGAVCVSDRVDGVEELFGGLVRMYDSLDSLAVALRVPAPDPALRRALVARIHENHSFDRRVERLIEIAEDVRNRRDRHMSTIDPPKEERRRDDLE